MHTAATVGRFEAEGWRIRKDGSRFWASAVVDAVRDEDGELIGFAKITRDMTDREQARVSISQKQMQAFGGSSMRSSITRSSRLILTGS